MYLPRRASCPKASYVKLAEDEAANVIDELSRPLWWHALVGVAAYAGHIDPDNTVQDALVQMLIKPVHPALERAVRLKTPGWEKRVYGWTARVIRWRKTSGAWARTDLPEDLPEGEAELPNTDRLLDGHDLMRRYEGELAARSGNTPNQKAAARVAKVSRKEGRPFVEVANEVAAAEGLVAESIRSEAARLDGEIIGASREHFAA